MKAKRFILTVLIICLCTLFLTSGGLGCAKNDTVTELGIPLAERFGEGVTARCTWDVEIFEGRLYVSGGDYGANTGPTDIWSYDLEHGGWTKSGELSEEAVTRFVNIGGELIALGTDPTDDWTFGNFYRLSRGEWIKKRTIPNGVHNFDMVEFDGKLFTGLGVVPGNTPVAFSRDGGESFEPVALIKEGAVLDTSELDQVRCYELLVHSGKLYGVTCLVSEGVTAYSVYRYDGNNMIYVSDFIPKSSGKRLGMNLFGAKLEFDGRVYYASDYLYCGDGIWSAEKVNLPCGGYVSDLLADGGVLYALASAEREDGYLVTVYRVGGEGYERVVDFTYSVPAICFFKDGQTFYLGMGSRYETAEKNGAVLAVKIP